MRESEQTRGVVLRRFKSGEADRVLIIFTRELGKVRAVARAVRRTQSKLAGHLEPLQESELQLVRGRGEFWTVTGARLIRGREFKMASLAVSSRAAELTDRLLGGELAVREIYDRFSAFLEDPGPARLLAYELQLLRLSGLGPSLGRCTVCGRPPGEGPLCFSAARGGIVHEDCLVAGETVIEIGGREAELLHRLADGADVALEDGLAGELGRIADFYVSFTLQRIPRSERLKAQLQGGADGSRRG